MHVLVIDNDASTCRLISDVLRDEGLRLCCARTAKDGLRKLRTITYDLVICEWLFAGESLTGLEIVQHIRASARPHTRVILLSTKSSLYDCVKGLGSGADEFIAKPFHLPELVARVKNQMRQVESVSDLRERPIEVGPICLYPRGFVVQIDGMNMTLTTREFRTLRHLALHANRVINRGDLVQEVWGSYEAYGMSNTIAVHISRIRKKLGKYGEMLQTTRGMGYVLRTN